MNTFPARTLFLTSLITFHNSTSFNPLSKLHWESLLYGTDLDKLLSTSYNKLNKLINKQAHFAHYLSAKLNNCQNHGLPKELENL